METLDTEEPATAEADTGDSATENTDENADGGTSADGEQGNADDEDVATLKQRIVDKDTHIGTLEGELRQLRQPKVGKKPNAAVPTPAQTEEDTLWLVENAPDLKMCRKEYQTYIAKGYSRPDALRLAKLDKGLIKKTTAGETQRNAETSTAVQGETRNPKPSKKGMTDDQKKIPGFKQEWLDKFGPEVEAKKKR